METRPPRARELSDYKWFFYQTELARAVEEQSQQPAKEGQHEQKAQPAPQQQQTRPHAEQRAQMQTPQQSQPQQQQVTCDGRTVSAAMLANFEQLNRATREAHATKDYSAAAQAYRALEAALGGHASVVSALGCYGVSEFYANHLRTWKPIPPPSQPAQPDQSSPQSPPAPSRVPPTPRPLDATTTEAVPSTSASPAYPSLERFSSISLEQGLLELHKATSDMSQYSDAAELPTCVNTPPRPMLWFGLLVSPSHLFGALWGSPSCECLDHAAPEGQISGRKDMAGTLGRIEQVSGLMAAGRFDQAHALLDEVAKLVRAGRQSAQRLASQLAAIHHARWVLMRLEYAAVVHSISSWYCYRHCHRCSCCRYRGLAMDDLWSSCCHSSVPTATASPPRTQGRRCAA